MTTMNATHTVRVVLDLTPEQKTGLKLIAAARNTNIMAILRELVDKELNSHEGLSLAKSAAEATLRKIRG